MTAAEARAVLDHYDACVFTARVTGRVVFGQLWVPEPTIDTCFRAYYLETLAAELNSVNPLLAMFRDA